MPLLIGCLASFLVLLGIAIYIFLNIDGIAFEILKGSVDQVFEEYGVSDEEKQAVNEELRQLETDLDNGKIGWQILAEVGARLAPAAEFFIISEVYEQNLKHRARFTPEELDSANTTLKRLGYARLEGKILYEKSETITAELSNQDATDEQIRDTLARAKALCDEAGVPDEVPDPDFAELTRQAIDEVYADQGLER